MSTLFPIHEIYPAGFSYIPEFIGHDEELSLIREIEKIPLHTFKFHGYEARRKVASFGYDYSFDSNRLTEGKKIPRAFHPLIEKVALHLKIAATDFAEVLLTEYPPGSVINWHRDAHPFDIIAGISLLSDCTFRLRPYEKEKQGRGSVLSITTARRSLYVIRDESRTDWQHSIAPVKNLRYSITLRTLRKQKSRYDS